MPPVTGNSSIINHVILDTTANISFVDKSFDSNNISHYHLSLQVFLEGFSFTVLDRARNKFIALHHEHYPKLTSYQVLTEALQASFNNNPLLKLPFNHVKCLFATPKYTFIPSVFYQPQTVTSFFSLTHDLLPSERIETNYLYSNANYVAFAMPNQVRDFLTSQQPQIRFFHHTAPLIEEVLLTAKQSEHQQVLYINMYHHFFDIAFVDSGNLKLVNTFSHTSQTDFLYFCLNTVNQLKLMPQQIPVYLLGDIPKNSLLIEQLKQYLKNIDFLNKPEHFNYCFDFVNQPNHTFTNLINLYQCA